jgi:hypothetical protein
VGRCNDAERMRRENAEGTHWRAALTGLAGIRLEYVPEWAYRGAVSGTDASCKTKHRLVLHGQLQSTALYYGQTRIIDTVEMTLSWNK